MSFGVIDSVIFGARLTGALIKRPHLMPTALRQAHTLAPTRWWATRPHLPLPSSAYMRFRQVTATGSDLDLPAVDDVLTWLEWCRSMRALPRVR